MQSLKLKKFNPRTIEKTRTDPDKGPPTIIVIGPRGTGKTYLVEHLMYYVRRIPAGMMITGSEASAESFSRFFPKSFIYDDVDIERIEKIAKTQTKLRKKKTEGDYSSLIVFDDCGYDKKITREKIIKKIFCNGRHLKILLLMTVQYCIDIPPDLRSNADFVFILKENKNSVRRKLFKEYVEGIIKDFNTFDEIMDVCTEDRGLIVINNTTTSNNILDRLFWYKCPEELKNFKLGSESFWKFHEENYKSEEDSSGDELFKEKPKKNVNKVVVKKLKRKKKKSKDLNKSTNNT